MSPLPDAEALCSALIAQMKGRLPADAAIVGIVTGGAWLKERQVGVGFHWRGQTEPVLVFMKRGAPAHVDRDHLLLNGYASIPEEHSRKPLPWLRTMLRAWTAPDAMVLDLWAGLAPMAAACKLEGRNYIGAEIDPARHADGCRLVARAE